MKCELQPDYLSYAAGSLEDPERVEIRRHLAEGCEHCSSSVRAARAWLSSMGGFVEGPDPSRALRDRVLAISGAAVGTGSPRLAVVQPRTFWGRPIASWQGLALAAGIAFLACLPAVIWYRHSIAQQNSAARLLADERHSSALLREQVARLESAGAAGTVPIFSLDLERGAGVPAKTLTIPPGAGSIVLALPQDLMREASEAELRNAAGQPLWTLSPLAHGGADLTGLRVPAGELRPGVYTLILRAGGRTLASVSFRIDAR